MKNVYTELPHLELYKKNHIKVMFKVKQTEIVYCMRVHIYM